ncbi:MAG: hypothetical protein HY909_03720 [Deltaproteobacteria bacterium]|nr:hypothetical protein [Deltaproteobacteria bacterium]
MHLQSEVSFIQHTASRAGERLAFAAVLKEVTDRQSALPALLAEVQRLRGRGYVFSGDLELRHREAVAQCAKAADTARKEGALAAQQLRGRVDALGRDARKLGGVSVLSAERQIESAAQEARSVDSALDGAERRARESIGGFLFLVDDLKDQLERLHWSLDQFEAGSFKLQPEENPLYAVKCTWEDAPQGKKEGVLLLTDHRVRFEAQEEVVLERTLLFFASKTEWRKALVLDQPLGHLTSSTDSERGLLMKDQLLTLTFTPGKGAPERCTLELDNATAKVLDGFVEQLRKGNLERSRYQGPMPEGSLVGVPVRWPEKCSECGAGLKPPVKGQTTLQCEYCKAHHDVVLGQG